MKIHDRFVQVKEALKVFRLLLISITILFMLLGSACSQKAITSEKGNVGLLVPQTINDPVWGSKGYKGLLKIQSELHVDVFYKEGIKTEEAVRKAIKDFQKNDVNLIFGHGSEYEHLFKAIHNEYPEIKFVYFNGEFSADNVTSLKFKSHAMGFFGGMVAAKMSKTNKVGVIAAFPWQPEVQGFVEGAKYQNSNVDVEVKYTSNWDDVEKAKKVFKDMVKKDVDVFYPAGDLYNIQIIKQVKEKGLYAIGFVSDQSDLGEATVLTSTVQHVDKVYEIIGKEFANGKLVSGVHTYDFQDDVITMGKFSQEIPLDFKLHLKNLINEYKETGKLPNK